MPRIPVAQHQKIAPGPPKATAVETPMILPVPKVAARVVDKVANTERLFPPSFLEGVTDRRMALKIFFCGKSNFMVKYKWVPIRRNKRGPLHRN